MRRSLLLAAVLLLFFVAGCARLSPLDTTINGPPASSTSDYPPITEELLQNGPEPGHPILRIEQPQGAMGVEFWDYAERWIQRKEGGEVYTAQGSGCSIGSKALPNDTLVTVSLPVQGYAIVDFGPHPTYFNKNIWIALSLNGTGLGPRDIQRILRLGIYYWNEETGTYERYWSYYDPYRNALMCQTNHFSRYIIA
ncbi:MAG: hypothetical protein V1784_02105 [bacterium]